LEAGQAARAPGAAGIYRGVREPAVKIPRVLRPIHGETPRAFDVFLVYAVGVVFGILAVVVAWSRVAALPAWKALILFLLAADASGGTVSGFSSATAEWFANHPGFRRAFPFFHIIGPALLCLLFDGRIAYWAFLYGFTASAASVVMLIGERSRQEAAAAALVAVGTVVLLPIGLATPFLAWFAPIYMLKLILGFGVNRST
jgi:hypothetical protein